MAITRIEPGKRMSNAVVHNSRPSIGGRSARQGDVKSQAVEALAGVDRLLAIAGTDKTRVLQAIVWLADTMADFAAMNPRCGKLGFQTTPARATGEASWPRRNTRSSSSSRPPCRTDLPTSSPAVYTPAPLLGGLSLRSASTEDCGRLGAAVLFGRAPFTRRLGTVACGRAMPFSSKRCSRSIGAVTVSVVPLT